MFAKRFLLSMSVPLAAGALLVSAPPALTAQQVPSGAVVLDSAFLAAYRWHNLGPDRGGRSIAVSGVKGRPHEAYFGAVGGGLWKTSDGGGELGFRHRFPDHVRVRGRGGCKRDQPRSGVPRNG